MLRLLQGTEHNKAMSDLFNTGIRPAVDAYLKKKSEEVRDYGEYWSASSAGYCMRLNIMRRLGVPKVPELEDSAALTRIFEAGHIFHEWMQRITKDAGLSIASEVELQDEDLMVRGHFDDLVLVGEKVDGCLHENLEFYNHLGEKTGDSYDGTDEHWTITCADCDEELAEGDGYDDPNRYKGLLTKTPQHLILYDYKTAHSASFNYSKNRPMGHYHTMQLATYMYMIRSLSLPVPGDSFINLEYVKDYKNLTEARILSISKDDLRMEEKQLLWTPELEKQVVEYWSTLNGYWKSKTMPKCTCLDYDGGFMGRRSSKGKVYNDFFWEDEPCSLKWYEHCKKEGLLREDLLQA
jgi:hypothetical protein